MHAPPPLYSLSELNEVACGFCESRIRTQWSMLLKRGAQLRKEKKVTMARLSRASSGRIDPLPLLLSLDVFEAPNYYEA